MMAYELGLKDMTERFLYRFNTIKSMIELACHENKVELLGFDLSADYGKYHMTLKTPVSKETPEGTKEYITSSTTGLINELALLFDGIMYVKSMTEGDDG